MRSCRRPAGAALARKNSYLLFLLALAVVGQTGLAYGAPTTSPSSNVPLSVSYTIPTAGEVTLGLYDQSGGLLRWIRRGEYDPAGRNSATWDGLDQWGHPVPAGRYTLRGLYHPPLSLEYGLTLGNPGTPPWVTVDGKGDWLSDEQDPQAAATDGKWVFLAAPGSEKGFAIIGVDQDGHRQWGAQVNDYSRCVSLAIEGDELYALFCGPELTDATRRYNGHNAIDKAVLLCLDKRTGRPARFSIDHPRLAVATWPYREQPVGLWEVRSNDRFAPETFGGQPRYSCDDLGEPANALGIAALGGKLYVSFFQDDHLAVLDAATGRQLDEISLTRPVGLHATRDGQLLAVSAGKVVRVDPSNKSVRTVVDHDLLAPHSLATDMAGNIFVSDWGKSFQVKVFSPDGKFLHAIGKAGGRGWVGRWDDNGMLVPRGVAVTDDGKLWVAEDDSTPKRVSVWDAGSGAFLSQYVGPTAYGGGGAFWADPKDATIAYTLGTRFKLDWQHRSYSPMAVVTRRMDRDQPFALNGHASECIPRVMYHDGNEYVVSYERGILSILMRKGEVYVPVAAVGGISRLITDDGTGKQIWDSNVGYHVYKDFYPECFRGHSGDNFCWTDTNGDGLVQPEEMHWVKTLARGDHFIEGRQPEWLTGWGFGIAPDWSVFVAGFCRDSEVIDRLDVKSWTPGGAPVFDPSSCKQIMRSADPASVNGLYVNNEGKLFVAFGYEFQKSRPDVLNCMDRDGHVQWRLAMPPQVDSPAQTGVALDNVIGEFTVPGLGNVLGTWLWHSNYRPYLLTSDGMYISKLLEDTKVGPAALWDESNKNYFQTPDGSCYINNGASDGHHLLKILGLSGGGRFEQPVDLTDADVRLAAAARASPVAIKPPRPVIGVPWFDTPPAVKGDLAGWNLDAGAHLDGGKDRSADVTIGRDPDTLYLAYHVHGATLVNKGDDWRTLFISGDCVDLMLATDPAAALHREKSGPGDIRLLLGAYHDQPIAVLYRPVAPGVGPAAQLMAARFDQIVRLDRARVAFVREDHGYTLTAAVPLSDLGIDPQQRAQLRGDVGVMYADDTGRSRSQRLYYYNARTNITADLTTEATLQPNEWGPICMPLGKNLVRNGGFESALVTKPTDGWFVSQHRSGGEVDLSADMALSGHHSLRLRQTTPIVFTPQSFKLADYAEFVRSANGGAGRGEASVAQTFPVVGGHRYTLRLSYLAQGLKSEQKHPGPDRGYAAFSTWLYWGGGPKGVRLPAVWITNSQGDTDNQWKQAINPQVNYWSVARPYQAPEGATTATLSMALVTVAPDRQPVVYVDDVELVEEPPGQ